MVGAGVSTAGIFGLYGAGSTPAKCALEDEARTMHATPWHEDFDVVCVGYGFAGAAAAVAAHDAGARVLVVEKMAHPGGISICSAGGVRISRDAEASLRYLVETNAGTTPEPLLRQLAEEMTRIEGFIRELAAVNGARVAVTWLPANYPFAGGDSFGFVTIKDIPGFDPERDFTWGRGLRGGTRLFKVMMDNVVLRGIQVRLGTAAERLCHGPEGVEGVLAGGRRIRARGGVVLACGGFEANAAMQAQYWQEKPVLPGAFLGNTGDGITMAAAAGAALWHMWHYHGTYGFRHPDTQRYPYGIRLHRLPDWVPGADGAEAHIQGFFAGDDDARMPWIVVDRQGRRYMNEYPPYLQDTGHRAMATYDPSLPGYGRIPSWLIVDEAGRRRGPLGFPTYNDADQSLGWSADNRAEIELGILQQAEVDRLVGEHCAAKADHGNRLWLLVNTEAWYRMHIDGQSREDLTATIAEAGHGGRHAAAAPRAQDAQPVAGAG